MAAMAFVFAGQGAQFAGMGKDLAATYPACRALFDRADAVLGYPLSRICFEGPVEELTQSTHCQPAIYVVSAACHAALTAQAGDIASAGMAGLSLGEWSALHVAGAVTFEDGLRILQARGRFMQEACEAQAGGMVSVIGLPKTRLEEICAATGVHLANLNSDEQTVLSGPKAGIEAAEKKAKEAGAKRTVVLNVAGAYHCPLMAPAAARLETALRQVPIRSPRVPVVSNVTGRPHGDPEEIRRAMVRQVTSPVQWASTIRWFQGQGVGTYLELGPGRVLAGLIRRIDTSATVHSIQDVGTLQAAVAALGK
jgi:[acyl-carrier-protein] S-malonyltransferase